jgi:hypothetical protein
MKVARQIAAHGRGTERRGKDLGAVIERLIRNHPFWRCAGRGSVDRRKFGECHRGGQVIYFIIGADGLLSDEV